MLTNIATFSISLILLNHLQVIGPRRNNLSQMSWTCLPLKKSCSNGWACPVTELLRAH